jgi:uracil DNA glycosylase
MVELAVLDHREVKGLPAEAVVEGEADQAELQSLYTPQRHGLVAMFSLVGRPEVQVVVAGQDPQTVVWGLRVR